MELRLTLLAKNVPPEKTWDVINAMVTEAEKHGRDIGGYAEPDPSISLPSKSPVTRFVMFGEMKTGDAYTIGLRGIAAIAFYAGHAFAIHIEEVSVG